MIEPRDGRFAPGFSGGEFFDTKEIYGCSRCRGRRCGDEFAAA